MCSWRCAQEVKEILIDANKTERRFNVPPADVGYQEDETDRLGRDQQEVTQRWSGGGTTLQTSSQYGHEHGEPGDRSLGLFFAILFVFPYVCTKNAVFKCLIELIFMLIQHC
jgi:hypothetical protein